MKLNILQNSSHFEYTFERSNFKNLTNFRTIFVIWKIFKNKKKKKILFSSKDEHDEKKKKLQILIKFENNPFEFISRASISIKPYWKRGKFKNSTFFFSIDANRCWNN